MKKINHKILMPILFCGVMVLVYFLNKDEEVATPVEKKLKFNERVEKEKNNTEEKKTEKNDINLVQYDELINIGLTKTIAEKLLDYREFTGTIKSYDELKRIKGFGEKTISKIKKLLIVDEKSIGKKNRLNINKAIDEELSMYGFNKKELEKINRWRDEKGSIFSNIDLIKIIGERRYEQLKSEITY